MRSFKEGGGKDAREREKQDEKVAVAYTGLGIAIMTNEKTMNKAKEGDSMSCEVLMELMAEEVKDPWGTGFRRGMQRAPQQGIFAMAKVLKEQGYDHDEAISLLMQTYELDRKSAENYLI